MKVLYLSMAEVLALYMSISNFHFFTHLLLYNSKANIVYYFTVFI